MKPRSSWTASSWGAGARGAATPSSVLITGGRGTGKEVIARSIHASSDRADGPFIEVNIAGIPDTLLESELFGYERGAFTGANARKNGLFEPASSGTNRELESMVEEACLPPVSRQRAGAREHPGAGRHLYRLGDHRGGRPGHSRGGSGPSRTPCGGGRATAPAPPRSLGSPAAPSSTRSGSTESTCRAERNGGASRVFRTEFGPSKDPSTSSFIRCVAAAGIRSERERSLLTAEARLCYNIVSVMEFTGTNRRAG